MSKSKGFTLVEIMIVVAIIGLLSSIAIPAFLKARNTARRNACINNLRQISSAKDQYGLEYGGVESSVYTESNISVYIKDMTRCFCPTAIGTNRVFASSYNILSLTSSPTCKISPTNDAGEVDHSLSYSVGN